MNRVRIILLAGAVGIGLIGAGCTISTTRPGVRVRGPHVVVHQAPPPRPRRVVVRSAPPASGAIWVDGHYQWNGHRHVWVGGHWQHPRAGHVYVQPRWERSNHGHVYHGGHWRPTPRRRGATVQVR